MTAATMPPEQAEARRLLAALIAARRAEDWTGWAVLGKDHTIEAAHALLVEAVHLSADLVELLYEPLGDTEQFLTWLRGEPA